MAARATGAGSLFMSACASLFNRYSNGEMEMYGYGF
jgi:hypothetical protein